MKGRPKSTKLKVLTGTLRPSREPQSIDVAPLENAPDWLTPDQRAIWDEAVANAPKGVLTALDAGVLGTWCVASDMHRQAAIKLQEEGAVRLSIKGVPVQSPWLGILNRQTLVMAKAAEQLGFTPASRSRVSAVEASDPENPWKKFKDEIENEKRY